MISGKLEPLLWMHHLEHRNFPLCCWVKTSLLQHSSNSLSGWFSSFSSTSLLILPTVPSSRPVLACIWRWEYLSLRRETTESHWAAERGLMMVVKRKKGGWTKFNMSNVYKQSHVTLFITFWKILSHILLCYNNEIEEFQNCPNDWKYFLIHYTMSFNSNHIIQLGLDSQDIVV